MFLNPHKYEESELPEDELQLLVQLSRDYQYFDQYE
jgi:hypothetical protein